MKFMICLLLVAVNVNANDGKKQSTQSQPDSVEKIVKEGKKERRKKAEMCNDCGKPEAECTCDGEKHNKVK